MPLPTRRPSITDDLGLGVKAVSSRWVNKDGRFNVRRVGRSWFRPYELYHSLITMGGARFLGLVLLGYLVTNALFAGIYLAVGMDGFSRPGGGAGSLDRALDAFFFSAQTLTTVGYGQISPRGHLASLVAALESLLGLLSFALATGLLYGRFSRPHARIRFSREALLAPYGDGTALMFRLVNQRSNQLIEVEATAVLSLQEPGAADRRFVPLALERKGISLFPTNWTVVHPIDETSPLYGLGHEDLRRDRVELIVLVKAFDDTFVQTLYQRTSYTAGEFRCGARFLPMTTIGPDGTTEVDLERIDAWAAAPEEPGDDPRAGHPEESSPGLPGCPTAMKP